MKISHRLTAMLLALLMLLTLLPAGVMAEGFGAPVEEGFGSEPVFPDEPVTEPTVEPTAAPTAEPTAAPTAEPAAKPTAKPTAAPVAQKAAFVAGLARISAGTRLYDHSGLWGAYVETVAGGVVYAAEQTADEKAIRIVLNNGTSLWEGWVKTDAVRMMSAADAAEWDAQERDDEQIRTYRQHELLPISTISSEPTPAPESSDVPGEGFIVVPLMTPEPGLADDSSDVEAPADEPETGSTPDEEEGGELFSQAPAEATAAPLTDPDLDNAVDAPETGKFIEYRALSAPTNLSANHNRNGVMTLRWQGTEDAEGYQVLAKSANDTAYTVMATVYGTSWTTDALDPTIVYYFRVQAVSFNGDGSIFNASPHSASYPYIVLGDAKINDPRGKDTSTIRLTWTAVEGATHYDVMMSIHGANDWNIVRTDLVTDYCDIKDLSFDETYDFRVIPKRELSNGVVITGNSSRVIMVGSPMETPSFQQYDWTETGVKLTWDAIPGASGYVIYRRAFSDPDVTNYQKLVVLDRPVTTFTDTTMEPGEVYYYFVYSFKLCSPEGWRCFSLKGDIGMGVWLPKETGMTAQDYDASNILISWPTTPGANQFDLCFSKNAVADPATLNAARLTGNATYLSRATLNSTYYFYIRPVRVFSNGDISMGPWSDPVAHVHKDPSITYRALLIGNTYPGETNFLPGCDNDAYGMRDMLSRMPGTPYSISVQLNLSDTRMINAIRTTFADADASDVSLFYFSGHGANSPETAFHGALVGTLHTYLSVERLKEELDRIPGRKIVIIDSCHSGAMIGKSAGEDVTNAELAAFNSLVVNAFASDPDVIVKTVDDLSSEDANLETFSDAPFLPRGENDLANTGYYVITAAHSTEQSVSMGYDSDGNNQAEKYFGLFTYGLCYGNGWNLATDKTISTLHADRDSNGEITLYEAYVYAKATALRSNPNQTAQIWPSNSAYVIWAK